jgi:hypothetical protein
MLQFLTRSTINVVTVPFKHPLTAFALMQPPGYCHAEQVPHAER